MNIKEAFIKASEIYSENLKNEDFKNLNLFNKLQVTDKILYNLLTNLDRKPNEYILRDGTIILIDEEIFDMMILDVWKVNKNGYPTNSKDIPLHRIVMNATKGDGQIVDHIDRKKT